MTHPHPQDGQQRQMTPEEAAQAPMEIDEVLGDLGTEIGSLTVNLRLARKQNDKNTAQWLHEKATYETIIRELTERVSLLEAAIPKDAESQDEGSDLKVCSGCDKIHDASFACPGKPVEHIELDPPMDPPPAPKGDKQKDKRR